MKINVTVFTISDILSFAEKNLNIFWNQAHANLTEFIRDIYQKPSYDLIDFEDLYETRISDQGKHILNEFIKHHQLTSVQEILITQ